MATPKAKPLSFSTTLRNPERVPNFLKCILPFEGMRLTSSVIHEIVKNLIREKEYTPMFITRSPELKMIWDNPDAGFTEKQLEQIITMSPQKHKEKGFDYGWDSRFDTWYKMLKEFGFIKYAMNEPIQITSTGHMLVDAYSETPSNEKKIQAVFLNALMKYQTNNPLRRTLNDNAPLPFLLRVIKHFHEDEEENNTGLHRGELPILICWRDNDAEAAYRYLKSIRRINGFNYSDEFIYDRCLSILQSSNKNYFKMKKICHEAVDEYIRKMRMSGLLSLRGNGRFLDINNFEKTVAEYVISRYSIYPKFESEQDYINYMGTIDSAIIQFEQQPEPDFTDVRKRTLYRYARETTKEFIRKELLTVCSRRESTDKILRYINAPTRLEFLTSVALVQNFNGLDVNPNYSVDDEGLPTFTASGGKADIECHDSDYDSYFEVTLMCGRSDQVNNEIIPISRHLREAKSNHREESFSVFVAPKIHPDTIEAAEWQNRKYMLDIIVLNINEFIEKIRTSSRASQLLNHS